MSVHETVSAQLVRQQSIELLPERAAMAWITIAPVTAVNIAIAVNAASIASSATAGALQGVAVL